MADNLRYSSTVIAPAQIALGAISGIGVAIILEALDSNLWPLAILALLFAAGVGYYLATLTVAIDARHLIISQGRSDKNERLVNVDDITAVEVRTLTWQQCLGFGIRSDDLTTRMTVRPGSSLFVSLISGEEIRLSADNPEAAAAVLGHVMPIEPVDAPQIVSSELAQPVEPSVPTELAGQGEAAVRPRPRPKHPDA